MQYIPSRLEKAISDILIQKNILYPRDLRKETLSKAFGVEIFYNHVSTYSYKKGEYTAIVLNKHGDPKEQNFMFYHELAHIILHSGNQLNEEHYFIWRQELDANIVAHYVAVPYHMRNYIEFNRSDLVELMSDMFFVPQKVIKKRLKQIYERVKNQDTKCKNKIDFRFAF